MSNTCLLVLIHSPLVGPYTWELVREEFARRGMATLAPELLARPDVTSPFWQQHARSMAAALAQVPPNRSIVLVAHSGAGPLLPAIRQALPHSIGAYLFVDAGIPRSGLSRLDLMKLQDRSWADEFHQSLLQGRRFPDWTADDLRDSVPDETIRRRLLAELRPRSLTFFAEPLPAFGNWPDAPCAYLKLSAPYAWDAAQARQAGWPVRELDAGHFHLLVDPVAVTNELISIAPQL